MGVQFLDQEDPLKKEMTTHSSILAWRIPQKWTLEGYSRQGSKESDMTEATEHTDTTHTVGFMWRQQCYFFLYYELIPLIWVPEYNVVD